MLLLKYLFQGEYLCYFGSKYYVTPHRHTNTTHACPSVTPAYNARWLISCMKTIILCVVLLTKSVIRVGKEESIHRQEEKEDQIRDQVDNKEGSSISPPFVLQQTRHHWVSQQVITFILHLQQHKKKLITMFIADQVTFGQPDVWKTILQIA